MRDKIKAVGAWLRAHKGVAGLISSFGYTVLYVTHGGDPSYDTAREIFVWISGVLVGGGFLDADTAAKLKREREAAGLPERRT